MTVAKSYVPNADYEGDGINRVFESTEGLPEAMCEEVMVYVDGNLQPGSAYSVEWRKSEGHRDYAEVTLGEAPAAGSAVSVVAVPVMEQQASFPNGSPFHAESLEDGYDLLEYQVKYLWYLIGRIGR